MSINVSDIPLTYKVRADVTVQPFVGDYAGSEVSLGKIESLHPMDAEEVCRHLLKLVGAEQAQKFKDQLLSAQTVLREGEI